MFSAALAMLVWGCLSVLVPREKTPSIAETFTMCDSPVRRRSMSGFSFAARMNGATALISITSRSSGVDTSESWVDLHLKLALPAAAFIMMLVRAPLAIRGASTKSLPAAVAMGFAIGFTYFMVLGFTRALGQSGALPPLVAAWAANAIFLLFGAYLVLGTAD